MLCAEKTEDEHDRRKQKQAANLAAAFLLPGPLWSECRHQAIRDSY